MKTKGGTAVFSGIEIGFKLLKAHKFGPQMGGFYSKPNGNKFMAFVPNLFACVESSSITFID